MAGAALLVLAAAARGPSAQQPGAAATEPEPAQVQHADYVAHEWGTFTSMVGADGVVLEGLHREEEALPAFVHDLLKVDAWDRTESKLPASRVTQKMETPVIYFHTEVPLAVRVTVGFQKGLMTQFYPMPALVYPELQLARRARVDMSRIGRSYLEWDLDLIPRTAPAPGEIPPVPVDHPWDLARQVSAAWVRTRPEAGSPARPEAEHYVFYRGLGRWQPDLGFELRPGDAPVLHNRMSGRVPFVAALEVDDRGSRFVVGEPMAAGSLQEFAIGAARWSANRERVARELGAAVMRALVAEGLHVDEARAMVATWSRSWFQSPGARVIYLLPRSVVDEALPMTLEPQPRELVRALVGRLEYITGRAQQRVEVALVAAEGGDPAAAAGGDRALAALDRFLEPHLRNVARNGRDAAARAAAERRLAIALR